MRVRPAFAAVMTVVATAAALVVADPAVALNQRTCRVNNDYEDRDCITATLDLAGSNLFHIGTTGLAGRNSRLIVTDVANGDVVVDERQQGNWDVWRTGVHSDYTAYLQCNNPCGNATLYFANG